MKTKSFLILTLLGWLSVATAMAQELIVKGLVTDNTQEPLVGIIVKSKIQSVVTNANGRFELKANENDVLTFSGIDCGISREERKHRRGNRGRNSDETQRSYGFIVYC